MHRGRLSDERSGKVEDLGDGAVEALQIAVRDVGAWAAVIVAVEEG